ncbi:MAG: DNA-directed RNA polymerase subunit alpha [Candidatus Paceibacterota bacterium]|jgi:DNA-directed RNA polymerase subunit alpha
MIDFNIIFPSKPRIVSESAEGGIYEIEGLYPGYGHTLGNSLRRIILSSLPGWAITSIKIDGVNHEFSSIAGVKEDMINVILNLKKVRFNVVGDESQVIKFHFKGGKEATAKDLEVPGQVEVINPEQYIANVSDKSASLDGELTIEKGIGYIPSETLKKDKVEIGSIVLDAAFTPIKKANYEVENMRVGNRTDFNKLILHIETDGTISPHEALEKSIYIMIEQLKAIVGFKEEAVEEIKTKDDKKVTETDKEEEADILKTKIEDLGLSVRTQKALTNAGVRTVGGLGRKKEADVKEIEGLGDKGLQEIKKVLEEYGLTLK